MPEEVDLSDVLNASSKTSVKERDKKKTIKRIVISVALLLLFVVAFLFVMQTWFAKNDFTKPIPLSQNVTKWTSISWEPVNGKGPDPKTGVWDMNDSNGVYTNEETGCTALFTRTGGDYGDFNSDAKDTDKYAGKFTEGQEDTQTKKVFVPVANEPNGGLEVNKTSYINSSGNPSIAYYRHTPESTVLLIGVFSCDSEEKLNELVPFDGDGSEIKDFGVWVKVE